MYENILKIGIYLLSILFASISLACVPPIENPGVWDYYSGADTIFIGKVQSSSQNLNGIESLIVVDQAIKNIENIDLTQKVTVVSKGSSNECGYINPFFKNNTLLVFGNVNRDGEVEIKTYGGTREFISLDEADDYYRVNYVDDPVQCKQVYSGYTYEGVINECIEVLKTGCDIAYSESFLQSKIECDEKYVLFEETEDTCNDDIKVCRDGTILERVLPFCGFDDCPIFVEPKIIEQKERLTICTADVKQCKDGTFVSRGIDCEFEECPVSEPNLCNDDKKKCVDGTFVKRSPPHCSFDQCGTEEKEEKKDDGKCTEIWSGYKYNEEEEFCYQTAVQDCENTLFETRAECEKINEVEIKEEIEYYSDCSLDFDPVCGRILTIDSTYSNRCLMDEAGANFIKYGDCDEKEEGIVTRIINWFKNLFN